MKEPARAHRNTQGAEKNTWLSRLKDINDQNPGITDDILTRVFRLKMSAARPTDIITDMMREMRETSPRQYAKAMDHINTTHDFLFGSMKENHQ